MQIGAIHAAVTNTNALANMKTLANIKAVAKTAGTAPSPRLVRAAHEFEGQMMEELLKPMTAGDGLTGDDDESGSTGTLSDFASQALGQALSQQGGFGIADQIVKELSRSGNRRHHGKVTGNLHGDTVMRSPE